MNRIPEEHLHLVGSGAAAGVVAEAFRRLGRDEEIIHGFDSLHEGPIHDVDAGAASRVAWWSRLEYKVVGRGVRSAELAT